MKIEHKFFLTMGIVMIVLITIAGFSIQSINQLIKNNSLEQDSRNVMKVLNKTLSAVQNAETGQRGFIITGEESYLEPYTKGILESTQTINQLYEFAIKQNTPIQIYRVDTLKNYVALKIAELDKTISLKKQGQTESFMQIILEGFGKQTMDKIRGVILRMENHIEKVIVERNKKTQQSIFITKLFIFWGSLLSSLTVIVLILISRKDLLNKIKLKEELIEAKEKAEAITKDLKEAQKLANIGSWSFNALSQKAEWSEEMFNVWGYHLKKGPPDVDSLRKRIHPDDLALFSNSYNNAVIQGTPFDIEFRIYLPNGNQKTLRTICQTILDETGKTTYLTGANQDITSQKIFEKAQIKHERIKAIGEMSSSVAHDFNNSLQQITGNLEMIKFQKSITKVTADRLKNIESIIDDVAERVSALQKFGDTEHDANEAQLIDFNTLIKESLDQSRPLWKDSVEKKGLKINISTDFEDIPKISCNKGELKLAIYNLIKNSIEAMPQGGDLTIKTSRKNKRVFATFTDTGIGMDEKTKIKIFEPFFTTKGFELGRGLGMSGVFTTINKYNGTIYIKSSEVAKGTTIEIVFPESQPEAIQILTKNEQKEKTSHTILWVDDNSFITKDISDLMELMGHKCTVANSGKSALEYLNKKKYDIVFTDIGMPGMNGWELIAAIRNDYGNKIKIITVTGWNIDKKTKEKHTIDFVLQKPYTVQELEILFLDL